MARSFLAFIYIASLASCAASAQSDRDKEALFTIRSFQSNFFAAFSTRNLRFLSVPMETHWCTDEALTRLPWRDAFIQGLLLDWGIEEDKHGAIIGYARNLVRDKYVPLAYEMARAEDGACSYRTFFTSSSEVEEKLKPEEQERLRNWLPSVHALSGGLKHHLAAPHEDPQGDTTQQVLVITADLAQERERSKGLDRDLAKAREDILSLRAAQADLAHSATTDLTEERERSQGLERDLAVAREEASKLKDAQDSVTQQVSATAADLTQERERSQGLERDLTVAREQIRKFKVSQDGAGQQVSTITMYLAQERERSKGLERDLASARENIRILQAGEGDAAQRISATAEDLERERVRSQELSHDLASARAEIDNLKSACKSAAQQASAIASELAQERDQSQTLDRELSAARQQISTLMEIRTVMAHHADAAQQGSAAMQEAAREGARAQVLVPNLTAARVEIRTLAAHPRESGKQDSGAPASRSAGDGAPAHAIPDTNAMAGAAPSRDARRVEQDTPNLSTSDDKMLARAHALVLQGNIDGARLWLERAVETGSARAEFDLARTYDPHVLSIWKTYGVRGDLAKARTLYSRAYSRGITEAKERIEALK